MRKPMQKGVSNRGGRVLLADDDQMIRLCCAMYLKRMGFSVDSCADGSEAWTKLSSQPDSYEFALTDNDMPGMTGLQLIDKITSAGLHLPVILMSGSLNAFDLVGPQFSALRAFLAKPFGFEELEAAIYEEHADSNQISESLSYAAR